MVLVSSFFEKKIYNLKKEHKELQKICWTFIANQRSVHTQVAYSQDLKDFFSYLKDGFNLPLRSEGQLDFNSITRFHVTSYQKNLEEDCLVGKGYGPKTVIRKMAAVTQFFTYLMTEGLINSVPTQYLKRPKSVNLKETEALTHLEVKNIFKQVDPTYKSAPLHNMILCLLFYTGLRKSEIVNLKLEDYKIRSNLCYLGLIGKGEKKRELALHPICVQSINFYLNHLKKYGCNLTSKDFLIRPVRKGSSQIKVSTSYVTKMIERYAKKAGILKKVTPHVARATYITRHHEQGVRIEDISEEVGHSDINTTKIYIKRQMILEKSINFRLSYD